MVMALMIQFIMLRGMFVLIEVLLLDLNMKTIANMITIIYQ